MAEESLGTKYFACKKEKHHLNCIALTPVMLVTYIIRSSVHFIIKESLSEDFV